MYALICLNINQLLTYNADMKKTQHLEKENKYGFFFLVLKKIK